MSTTRGKSTKSEIIVRKYLSRYGFCFRVNVKRLPGTLDIALRKCKTAIFVNSCFRHGRKGCPEFHPLCTRVEWRTKRLSRNRARDACVREESWAMGQNTTVIWEYQLESEERQATSENVVRLLEKMYAESTYHAELTPVYPLLEEEGLPRVAEEEISYESVHHY